MNNTSNVVFNNKYDDDTGRIELDSMMAGSDSDIANFSSQNKINILAKMMDWAETEKENDWFASEMDDYFIQVFKDNNLTQYSDFFNDIDLVDTIFKKVFNAIPKINNDEESNESEDEEVDETIADEEPTESDKIPIESNEDLETPKVEGKNTATAKCPICGGKYLVNTGYCPKCKKKVAKTPAEIAAEKEKGKKKKEDIIIVIEKNIQIGDIILEKGDRIKIIEGQEENLVGMKVTYGSPGYSELLTIVSVKRISNNKWEITFSDDSFVTMFDKDYNEFVNTGKASGTNASSSMSGALYVLERV